MKTHSKTYTAVSNYLPTTIIDFKSKIYTENFQQRPIVDRSPNLKTFKYRNVSKMYTTKEVTVDG